MSKILDIISENNPQGWTMQDLVQYIIDNNPDGPYISYGSSGCFVLDGCFSLDELEALYVAGINDKAQIRC